MIKKVKIINIFLWYFLFFVSYTAFGIGRCACFEIHNFKNYSTSNQLSQNTYILNNRIKYNSVKYPIIIEDTEDTSLKISCPQKDITMIKDLPLQETEPRFLSGDKKIKKQNKFVIYGHVIMKQEEPEVAPLFPEQEDPEVAPLFPEQEDPEVAPFFPEQEDPEIIPKSPKIPRRTPHKKTNKPFKFTQYHETSVKNIYIHLSTQTPCYAYINKQCWHTIVEFDDGQTVDNFLVKVDNIATSECRNVLCPLCKTKYGINGYKMDCKSEKSRPYLSFFTPDGTNKWLRPKNGVFFLLEKGNYHSAWQEGNNLGDTNRNSITQAQKVIAKINYCRYIPKTELLLTIANIYEVTNRSNAVWFVDKTIRVSEMKNLPISAYIHAAPNYDPGSQLHERIHEYINTLSIGQNMVRYNNGWVYIGEKTVSLVKKDAEIDTTLTRHIIHIEQLKKDGLVMQDSGHLGDWGPESSPSNYNHQYTFRLGKYTMSVINEAGYYII